MGADGHGWKGRCPSTFDTLIVFTDTGHIFIRAHPCPSVVNLLLSCGSAALGPSVVILRTRLWHARRRRSLTRSFPMKAKRLIGYLNVDLEIESSSPLDSLAEEIGRSVVVLHSGPGLIGKWSIRCPEGFTSTL